MKYKFPVNISTKSDLIIQDLELFNKIAQDTWASIAFTITTLDEETEHFLEPGATPSRKRLEAIKLIHDNYPKIHVGVNFMPIVPFLEDSEENLERVVKESKQNGADYIHFAPGMTLRDNQRDFFLTKLRDFYPGLVEKYQNLYGDNSQPTSTYLQKLNKQLMTLCKQYDLATRLKRWIPEDFRKKNYRIAERLLNEAYYDKIQGRSYFNMQRVGLAIGNLKIPIDQLYTTGFLHQIEYMDDNVLKKIKPFLKKNKTVLDYF
jgi:DNA repair photolyase